jgi:hypothetical protein
MHATARHRRVDTKVCNVLLDVPDKAICAGRAVAAAHSPAAQETVPTQVPSSGKTDENTRRDVSAREPPANAIATADIATMAIMLAPTIPIASRLRVDTFSTLPTIRHKCLMATAPRVAVRIRSARYPYFTSRNAKTARCSAPIPVSWNCGGNPGPGLPGGCCFRGPLSQSRSRSAPDRYACAIARQAAVPLTTAASGSVRWRSGGHLYEGPPHG